MSIEIGFITTILTILTSSITSVLVSWVALKKIHSAFGEKLYEERLKAYREIFELVSEYGKTVHRGRYSFENLENFYDAYSNLDSKWSLLFNSDTGDCSWRMMEELGNILGRQQRGTAIDEESKRKTLAFLEKIENSLKKELGVYEFKNPFVTRYGLPKNSQQ